MYKSKGIHLELGQKDVIDVIRCKYGNMNQLYVCIEELGELCNAFADFCSANNRYRSELLDEVADFYIVARHLAGIIGYDLSDYSIDMLQETAMRKLTMSTLCSVDMERKAYSRIGDAIKHFSKLARYMTEDCDTAAYKAICAAHLVTLYRTVAYIMVRASLDDTWVRNRINLKVDRMREWVDNNISFKGTTDVRIVRAAEDGIISSGKNVTGK